MRLVVRLLMVLGGSSVLSLCSDLLFCLRMNSCWPGDSHQCYISGESSIFSHFFSLFPCADTATSSPFINLPISSLRVQFSFLAQIKLRLRLFISRLASANFSRKRNFSRSAVLRSYSAIVSLFLTRMSLCLHSMISYSKARYRSFSSSIFAKRDRFVSSEDFSLSLKFRTVLSKSIRVSLYSCLSESPPMACSRSRTTRYFSRRARYLAVAESANLNLTTASVSEARLQKGQWMNCCLRERCWKQRKQMVCCEEQTSMGQCRWLSYQRQQILQSDQSRQSSSRKGEGLHYDFNF